MNIKIDLNVTLPDTFIQALAALAGRVPVIDSAPTAAPSPKPAKAGTPSPGTAHLGPAAMGVADERRCGRSGYVDAGRPVDAVRAAGHRGDDILHVHFFHANTLEVGPYGLVAAKSE